MTRQWTIGVDFGGTNVKVGLVGPRGRIAAAHALASRDVGRPDRFVEAVSEAAGRLARSVGERPATLRGVGVGVPGPVDVRRGVVEYLVNVPGWRRVPLRRRLERRLGCRCAVDNDANLAALGEFAFGAGRGARCLVCLTLGTGVGGGFILDGSLVRGASGAAGEAGHMVIDPRGPRCGCGARGCLEAHVGTAALLRMGRRALRMGAEPLGRLTRAAGGLLTPALLSRAARLGDARARRIWEEFGRRLGIGVANLANLLNPDRVVLGGGVAGAWPLFYPSLAGTVRAQAMEAAVRPMRIVRARLGNRAGIVGAAVLIWEAKRGEPA